MMRTVTEQCGKFSKNRRQIAIFNIFQKPTPMIARSTFQTSDSHNIFESMNPCDCVETIEKMRSPSMSSSGYSSMGSDPNTPDFTPTSVYKFQLSPSAEPYYPKSFQSRTFYPTEQTHLKHSPKAKVNKNDLHCRV